MDAESTLSCAFSFGIFIIQPCSMMAGISMVQDTRFI